MKIKLAIITLLLTVGCASKAQKKHSLRDVVDTIIYKSYHIKVPPTADPVTLPIILLNDTLIKHSDLSKYSDVNVKSISVMTDVKTAQELYGKNGEHGVISINTLPPPPVTVKLPFTH